jgi:hypothetical protein
MKLIVKDTIKVYKRCFFVGEEISRVSSVDMAGAADDTEKASLYASTCTPATDLPEQSALLRKLSSHSMALAVEHAIEGPPGTVLEAETCGKCSSKIER